MVDIFVETDCGKLRGTIVDTIKVFKGVPYGAPTNGSNRFRPPRKPEAWSGVRDALEYGDSSPQPLFGETNGVSNLMGEGPVVGESEDCLRLNVWTPEVGDNRKRPVLFWCHGGAFTAGSGSGPFYNGVNLARRGDAVIVTINHRLGPMGFCYLAEILGEEFADSGNVGMLDIVAGLQWVRNNIEAFGGDPGNVTIFGESGGGEKVSVLLAMPAAQGLFHRAIVQSGPGVRMRSHESAARAAEQLLKVLEIAPSEKDRILALTTEQIFAANARVNRNPLGGWGPVVDGHSLPAHPFDPVGPALSADVPLLIGTNKDEFALFLMMGGMQLDGLNEGGLQKSIQGLIGDGASDLLEVYRRVYPKDSVLDIYTTLMSDHMIRIQSIQMAEHKAAQQSAPAFMYLFTWETPVFGGRLKSCHALEIPFVFDNLSYAATFTGDGVDRQPIADAMSETWLTFARSGSPGGPDWSSYTPQDRSTMIFDTALRVENDPYGEIREAWSGIKIIGIGE